MKSPVVARDRGDQQDCPDEKEAIFRGVLLLEQLNYNLLLRWFVGFRPDDPIWHPTTFTENPDHLFNEAVMGWFPEKLISTAELESLPSDEHVSVDGTLLQTWASHASLKRIDGQDDPPPPPSGASEGFATLQPGRKRGKGDWRGIGLGNDTHRSSNDPEARLYRKSKAHPALPSYRGHILMDNRNDLVVNCRVTLADGCGEREAAKEMAAGLTGGHQKTVGAYKGYDTNGFVKEMG